MLRNWTRQCNEKSVRLILMIIALAGFLFCLLSALGITDSFCLTQGCEVYQGYTIGGISLYWIGAAVFLVLGLMSLWPSVYGLLTILTGLALTGNFVFLIIQFLFWPCTSCLIVAALLGGFAWKLSFHVKSGLRILCMFWLLLFSANLLLVAKESVQPWPALGKNNAEIQVFFSPTCPACRQVVENFLQRPDLAPYLAFYPLAKDGDDRERIKLLVRNLRQGMPVAKAFANLWRGHTQVDSLDHDLIFAFNLWRNQLHLAKLGVTQVPFIVSRIPLDQRSDIISVPQEGCSIFSGDSENCEDNPTPDPFETLFK
jgi:thiol-disulfide isomerase/thioredoxin